MTTAGQGVCAIGIFDLCRKNIALGNATASECADYTVMPFSDFTRKVTMQNLFHDGGFQWCCKWEVIDALRKLNEMKKEPALIHRCKASMDKGRSRFFLCSLLFFFGSLCSFRKPILESRLSAIFRNTPVAIVPQIGPPLAETTLSATGFQFLYYRFIDKELTVDLGEASFEEVEQVCNWLHSQELQSSCWAIRKL